MSNLKLPNVQSYDEALKFLGKRESKRMAYATVAHRIYLPSETIEPEFAVAVKHHNTDIVTYYPDDEIELQTGGWDSATTVNRMNQLTPSFIRVNLRRDDTIVTDLRTKVEHAISTFTIRPA